MVPAEIYTISLNILICGQLIPIGNVRCRCGSFGINSAHLSEDEVIRSQQSFSCSIKQA